MEAVHQCLKFWFTFLKLGDYVSWISWWFLLPYRVKLNLYDITILNNVVLSRMQLASLSLLLKSLKNIWNILFWYWNCYNCIFTFYYLCPQNEKLSSSLNTHINITWHMLNRRKWKNEGDWLHDSTVILNMYLDM